MKQKSLGAKNVVLGFQFHICMRHMTLGKLSVHKRSQWKPHVKLPTLGPSRKASQWHYLSYFLFSWQQEKLGDDPISTLSFLSIQLNIIFASQRLTTFWLQKTRGEKQTNLSSDLNLLYLPLSLGSKFSPVIQYTKVFKSRQL